MVDHPQAELAAREQIRAQLVTGMLANGISPSDAHMAADVAIHATDTAMDRFMDTVNRVDAGEGWLNAMTIGLQLLIVSATRAVENVRELSKSHGLSTGEFKVSAR